MKNLNFYMVYGFLWVITLLPLRILYLLSDFIYILLFYVVRYRRKVILKNLRNAFPEKPSSEIVKITKSFYHHLADFFIETLKAIHLPERKMRKHMVIKNPELLQELYDQGKDVVLISGHYGNWEWGNILSVYTRHSPLVIYMPLRNKTSDVIINRLRSKFGLIMVPMKDIYKEILRRKEKGEKVLTWFLGDQRPPKNAKYWTTFLNQDTAIYLGSEKIARKLNQAVVFMDIQKRKRGFYEMEFSLLFRDTKGTNEYEITEGHVRKLEEIIRKRPDFWLWSHNRWKHKKIV